MPFNTLSAIFTDAAREKYAAHADVGGALAAITAFRVGLGGYTSIGTPRVPDPTLTDLDIIENPSRYPEITNATPAYIVSFPEPLSSPQLFNYKSASGNIFSCVANVEQTDYNNCRVSGPPEAPVIWEIGLYDSDGTMVAYATYSGITKDVGVGVQFAMSLVF